MEARLENPELLKLYHGTLTMDGPHISIRSGAGVGWNSLTLGDAFYTSPSLEAATLFSHLVLQRARMKGVETYDNLGFAKVYNIFLQKGVSILDADKPLDASSVQGVLLRAGVSQRYLRFCHKDQLSADCKSANLLCYGAGWEGNRNEYLTKALGYDGLMIKESAWQVWDYYPTETGIDWEKFKDTEVWPPKTLAIYNPSAVAGFELFHDGRVYTTEQGLLPDEIER